MKDAIVNIVESNKHCISHKCNDCGEELHPDQWGASLLMLVIVIFFAGFVFFMNSGLEKSMLDPRCWAKDDMVGVGLLDKEAVSAIKQFPIDCDTFNEIKI